MVDHKLLHELVVESESRLANFCANSEKYVSAAAGGYYGGKAAESFSDNDREPVNMMELAKTIFMTHLATNCPSSQVSTFVEVLKPTANMMRLALNQTLKRVSFKDTLYDCTQDALFGMGIAKVGVAERRVDSTTSVGELYIDRISVNDWIHDTTARSYEDAAFAGHIIRVNIEDMLDNPDYDQNVVDYLVENHAKSDTQSRNGTRPDGDTSLAHRHDPTTRRLYKSVDLYELWLPREGTWVTLPKDGNYGVLAEREYFGPRKGPFSMLRFGKIPNEILPSPPAAYWFDNDALIKRLYLLICRQALRGKKITVVESDKTETVEAIIKGQDGDTAVAADLVDAFKEIVVGGVDGGTAQTAIHMRDIFMMMGGNLDALGGLGPLSETASQDKMISATSSRRLTEMQTNEMNFVKDIMENVAWELWNNPDLNEDVVYRTPGTSSDIHMTVTQEDLHGQFESYDFNVEPYSRQCQTPQERLQVISSVFHEYILPTMQAFGDPSACAQIIRQVADSLNIPELEEVFRPILQLPPRQQDEVGQTPLKTDTHSIYERRSNSGGTRRGSDRVAMQTFGGQNVQSSEGNGMPGVSR